MKLFAMKKNYITMQRIKLKIKEYFPGFFVTIGEKI